MCVHLQVSKFLFYRFFLFLSLLFRYVLFYRNGTSLTSVATGVSGESQLARHPQCTVCDDDGSTLTLFTKEIHIHFIIALSLVRPELLLSLERADERTDNNRFELPKKQPLPPSHRPYLDLRLNPRSHRLLDSSSMLVASFAQFYCRFIFMMRRVYFYLFIHLFGFFCAPLSSQG